MLRRLWVVFLLPVASSMNTDNGKRRWWLKVSPTQYPGARESIIVQGPNTQELWSLYEIQMLWFKPRCSQELHALVGGAFGRFLDYVAYVSDLWLDGAYELIGGGLREHMSLPSPLPHHFLAAMMGALPSAAAPSLGSSALEPANYERKRLQHQPK